MLREGKIPPSEFTRPEVAEMPGRCRPRVRVTLPQPKFTWPSRGATAEDVLRWGLEEFGDGLAICTSFQATGSVIIDMVSKLVGNAVRVFSIDTGRLHQETYDLVEEVRRRYGIVVELVAPDARSCARC